MICYIPSEIPNAQSVTFGLLGVISFSVCDDMLSAFRDIDCAIMTFDLFVNDSSVCL